MKQKYKNIRVSTETDQRIAKRGKYGQTKENIILEILEERKFQRRATPVLEKAKQVLAKHEKVGSNWAEVEQSWRELITLLGEFIEELRRR